MRPVPEPVPGAVAGRPLLAPLLLLGPEEIARPRVIWLPDEEELVAAKSSSAVRGCACPDRALTACRVRTGIPVLRTSSAVTRTRRGFKAVRVLEVEAEGRRGAALGAALGAERAGTGLEAGRATVSPDPIKSSMVRTRGALLFLGCLWGRAGVRLVPRSWSAVRVITRGLLGPADVMDISIRISSE